MQTKIQKWGNSLGLRIPRSYAMEARVGEGSTVEISIEHGRLYIRAIRAKKYALKNLLKEIRPDNLHGEVKTGTAAGREAW